MRHLSTMVRAAFAFAAVALLLPTASLAQDTASLTGLFNRLDPLVFDILTAFIAIGVGYFTKRVNELTGVSIDAKHRTALQAALEDAAHLAIGHIENKIAGKLVDRGHPALLAATKYVRRAVPDAVDHFDLTDEKIVDLLAPKLVPKASA